PNDARVAVRAAPVVPAGEAIDPHDAQTAARQMAQGGAADAARADDEDVRVDGHVFAATSARERRCSRTPPDPPRAAVRSARSPARPEAARSRPRSCR